MNPDIEKLFPYPFEKLATLLRSVEPPDSLSRISLSLGEPRHAPPGFVLDALVACLEPAVGTYPVSKGIEALRAAAGGWFQRRFGVTLDPDTEILPVGGSREGLFSIAQAVIDRDRPRPTVLMPNPFYQIYEGGALLAGAKPYYLNTVAANGYVPDLDAVAARVWDDCQLIYVCSPGNPTGTVLDATFYKQLIDLADRHDFLIVADECYCELYRETPPVSLLEVCHDIGRDDFSRCIVFHSLSKRSNLPGLRSGFVAGDRNVLEGFLRYRTYHGAAMSEAIQIASVAAWSDDAHVTENRAIYSRKYKEVGTVFKELWDCDAPPASFYLWPYVNGDDESIARELYSATHVVTLPGSYLARDWDGINPGAGHLRISLVAPVEDCVDAAERIRSFVSRR